MLTTLIPAAALLALSAYLVGEVVTQPERDRRELVRRAARYGAVRISAAAQRERLPLRERVFVPASARVASWMLRANPRETLEQVHLRLLAAGMTTVSPSGFLAAKGMLAGAGLFFGILFGISSGVKTALLFAVALGFGGFIAPGFVVGSRARKRQDQIQAALPDALDLLSVSVEAGLGFDGAITKLTEHMDGPLIDELSLALGEMRVGEARPEALRRMSERIDTPEVSAFIRAVIQADQMGTSLGKTLRIQAQSARLKRQAAAEEKAMKAPIKMLFPSVAFIFPAMFIVILGPAFLNLSKLFGF
jgi:tight adherence protein C